MTDASSSSTPLGNPFTQQRDLARGNAAVVFPDRGVVALTGTERLSYLDSLVSQDVARLTPGESAEALLLDPNGRVERAMRLIDDGLTSWLLVDRDQAAPLAAFLDRMTFSKDAAARDASDEFVTVGFFEGGTASAAIAPVITSPAPTPVLWVDPWRDVVAGGWQYADAVGHPAAGWNYREALVERSREPAIAQAVELVAPDAWDALRVAAWRPSLATEVDGAALPHETDWLRTAVHLNKGCYRGQETVAKVHNLGHPPRRLTLLHLDGSTNILPAPGAEVMLDGEAVGHVTIAVRHFEDGPIALALLKRSVPAEALLTVASEEGEVAASQVVIVPADAGKAIEVPRIPRLGAVSREG
jgi:folate-binding protein YgfZ